MANTDSLSRNSKEIMRSGGRGVSLRWKIMGLMGFSALLGFAVIAGVAVWYASHAMHQQIEDDMKEMVEIAAEKVQSELHFYFKKSEAITKTLMLDTSRTIFQELDSIFNTVDDEEYLYYCSFIDKNGKGYTHTGDTFDGSD